MGRSKSIIDRFPSFFQSKDWDNNFYRFIEVFSQMLEQVELDLQKVMRSHWVDTADNEDSKGFDASQKGDLDKIFSLYLSSLGGTSLLRQLNRIDKIDPKYAAYINQLIAQAKFGFATRKRLKDKIKAVVVPAADFTGRLADLDRRLGNETYSRQRIYDLLKEEKKSDGLYQEQLDFLSQKIESSDTESYTREAASTLLDEALPLQKYPQWINRLQYLKAEKLAEEVYTKNELLLLLGSESDLRKSYQKLLTASLNQLYRSKRFDWRVADVAEETAVYYPKSEIESLLAGALKDYPVSEGLLQNLKKRLPAEEYRQESLIDILKAEIDPDKIYRDRIKGLIEVLKHGASTREGIRAIVAANLGIVGDSQAVVEAKKLIRLEEYLPERVVFTELDLNIAEEFTVHNPNSVKTRAEISIRFNNVFDPRIVRQDELLNYKIVNLKITNLDDGRSIQHLGFFKTGQQLVFINANKAEVNGVDAKLTGLMPELPPGDSTWKIEANLAMEAAKVETNRIDRSRFDVAVFDENRQAPFEDFDTEGTALVKPLLHLSIFAIKRTPGAFTVVVPWHIPGFTDKFEALSDHPRNKILHIVNKVKAAGFFAALAYELRFREELDMEDARALYLEVRRKDEHEIKDALTIASLKAPYPGGQEHGLEDRVHITGVFGYTNFNSLNTFG